MIEVPQKKPGRVRSGYALVRYGYLRDLQFTFILDSWLVTDKDFRIDLQFYQNFVTVSDFDLKVT